MALPSGAYAPRSPAASVLYQVVRDHHEAFRVEAAGLRDGEGLPPFVEEEFEAFLRCGWHAAGFARLRCPRCREERLVAFSCKPGSPTRQPRWGGRGAGSVPRAAAAA